MESPTSPESLPVSSQIQAIQELTRGRELVNILRETLWWPKTLEFDCTSEDDLVVQIQSIFENTLSIMGSRSSSESLGLMASDLDASTHLNEHKANHSNQSLSRKPAKTRRKNSWTSAQVSSILVDDGHVWRKYGQKHIINKKYHRSYYRCTYKFDQRCLATKQVQMIQENPPKYRTTYNGEHACKNLLRAPQIILDTSHDDVKDSSILLSFETNGVVDKKQVDHKFGAIKHEFKEMFPSTNNFRDNISSSDNYMYGDHPNVCVSEQPLELISTTSMANVAKHVGLGGQWIQQLQTDCYYQIF